MNGKKKGNVKGRERVKERKKVKRLELTWNLCKRRTRKKCERVIDIIDKKSEGGCDLFERS